jgi:hypothetical protein
MTENKKRPRSKNEKKEKGAKEKSQGEQTWFASCRDFVKRSRAREVNKDCIEERTKTNILFAARIDICAGDRSIEGKAKVKKLEGRGPKVLT